MIVPIILSGGSGTRLWPLSRKHYPKQFISLVNQTTLFQDTILRLPDEMDEPTIICNESHRFLVAEQLRQINKQSNNIILEPIGKNTAPAITLAALKLTMNKQDPVLFVLPADHSIQNKEAFHESIKIAETLAEQKKLVTFGVPPTQPETGYGYIEVDNIKTDKYYNINSFREKPTKKNAKKYQESTNYYWNSGMFMFKASVYLDELEKFENGIKNPTIEELKKIAESQTINIRDLLPNDKIEKKVIVKHHEECKSWFFPEDSKCYKMYELVTSTTLPFSKSFEIEILDENSPKLDLRSGTHQYAYNIGKVPVAFNWKLGKNVYKKEFHPGDSLYIKPFISHNFRGNGKIIVLRIGGKTSGDAQRELSIVGKDNAERAISETTQWFDPQGKN